MNKVTSLLASAAVINAATIFDDDHDFMKGFETGIMIRTKDTTIEEFGCKLPDISENPNFAAFLMIDQAMSAVKPFLPDDYDIENAFDMVQVYMSGLTDILSILDPNNRTIDDYCRGMVFATNGSNVLVKVATYLRS